MGEHLGRDAVVEVLSKFQTVVRRNTVKRVQSGANIFNVAVTFSIMTSCYGKDPEHKRYVFFSGSSYFCFALTLSR